jgi:hypothetical protein
VLSVFVLSCVLYIILSNFTTITGLSLEISGALAVLPFLAVIGGALMPPGQAARSVYRLEGGFQK